MVDIISWLCNWFSLHIHIITYYRAPANHPRHPQHNPLWHRVQQKNQLSRRAQDQQNLLPITPQRWVLIFENVCTTLRIVTHCRALTNNIYAYTDTIIFANIRSCSSVWLRVRPSISPWSLFSIIQFSLLSFTHYFLPKYLGGKQIRKYVLSYSSILYSLFSSTWTIHSSSNSFTSVIKILRVDGKRYVRFAFVVPHFYLIGSLKVCIAIVQGGPNGGGCVSTITVSYSGIYFIFLDLSASS